MNFVFTTDFSSLSHAVYKLSIDLTHFLLFQGDFSNRVFRSYIDYVAIYATLTRQSSGQIAPVFLPHPCM